MLLPRSGGPTETQELNLNFDPTVDLEDKGTANHTLDTGFLALGKVCGMNSSADIDLTTLFLLEENSLPDRLMMKSFLSLSCILKNKNKAIRRIMTSK